VHFEELADNDVIICRGESGLISLKVDKVKAKKNCREGQG